MRAAPELQRLRVLLFVRLLDVSKPVVVLLGGMHNFIGVVHTFVEFVDTESHVTAADKGMLVLTSHLSVAHLHRAGGFSHLLDRRREAWLPRAQLRLVVRFELIHA